MIIPDNAHLQQIALDVQLANNKWQEARELLAHAQEYVREANMKGWGQHIEWSRNDLNAAIEREHKAAEEALFQVRRYRQAVDAATAQTAPDVV